MKRKKKKLLVKSARKVIRRELNEQLIVDIEETLGKFGQDSKAIKKEIKKSADKLAKRLSQKLNIELSEVSNEDENVIVKSKTSDHDAKAVTPVPIVKPEQVKPVIQKTAPARGTKKTLLPVDGKVAAPVEK